MTYPYRCPQCGFEFELDVPMELRDHVSCYGCGAPAERDRQEQFRSQHHRIPIGFHTCESDILPRELIGAGKSSSEWRDYALRSREGREV